MKNIGKLIYSLLKDIPEINKRCFPLVCQTENANGLLFPFITYQKDSMQPQDTKDRMIYEWEHSVIISVITDNYDQLFDIVTKVIDKVKNLEGEYNDIYVSDSVITEISEDFVQGAYLSNITLILHTD